MFVDFLAVTGPDMVDDDLGSEGAADGPIRLAACRASSMPLMPVSAAAAAERGAKADDQQLVLADFIFVAGSS